MQLRLAPHFQSSQIGAGEEFDFPDKNYKDDDNQIKSEPFQASPTIMDFLECEIQA
jgi:hypothetical protein